MKVRRKSLHRSANSKNAKKRANQRAAKERHRIARAAAPISPEYIAVLTAMAARCPCPPARRSGFRVTIECLDDGERATFTSARGPHGLTISPTSAARRVAAVMLHYVPAPKTKA